MAGRHLLGGAGIALSVVAFSASAQAADVMPVVVPAVTPVVVAPAVPTVALRIDTGFNVLYDGHFDAWINTRANVKITAASGWGFQLIAGGNQYVVAPIEFYGGATGRVFHAGDALEFGVYGGFALNPSIVDYTYAGGDFKYDTDRVTIEGNLQGNFVGGGFIGFSGAVQATLHVNDRLDLTAGAHLRSDLGLNGPGAWLGAELDLGVLTPYASVYYRTPFGFGAIAGVRMEKPLGTGPFSLTGYAEAEFDAAFGTAARFGIGIRFSRGDID